MNFLCFSFSLPCISIPPNPAIPTQQSPPKGIRGTQRNGLVYNAAFKANFYLCCRLGLFSPLLNLLFSLSPSSCLICVLDPVAFQSSHISLLYRSRWFVVNGRNS